MQLGDWEWEHEGHGGNLKNSQISFVLELVRDKIEFMG